jgi:hypothetical protein
MLHLQQIYSERSPIGCKAAAAPHPAMEQEIRTKQLKFPDSVCGKQEGAGRSATISASAAFQ